jgi:hypothetical protein
MDGRFRPRHGLEDAPYHILGAFRDGRTVDQCHDSGKIPVLVGLLVRVLMVVLMPVGVEAVIMAVAMIVLVLVVVVMLMLVVVTVLVMIMVVMVLVMIMVVMVLVFLQDHVEIAGVDPGLFDAAYGELVAVHVQACETLPQHFFVRAKIEQRSHSHIPADTGVAF